MKIWEVVKEIEEAREGALSVLGETKATMIINFGEKGKARPGLITGRENLFQMVVKVYSFYEKKLKELEEEKGDVHGDHPQQNKPGDNGHGDDSPEGTTLREGEQGQEDKSGSQVDEGTTGGSNIS